MPNWCMGYMEIKGDKENIINFLKNGLHPIGVRGKTPLLSIEETANSITISHDGDCFYVEGTRRNFVDQRQIEFVYDASEEKQTVVFHAYQGAWSVDAEPLAEISGVYQITMEVEADEPGMGFQQHIIVSNGEILEDSSEDLEEECDCGEEDCEICGEE